MTRRIVPLLALFPAFLPALLAGHRPAAAAPAPAAPPALGGIWAMQGTGPAGLVAAGGRIATLTVRQRGHALSIAVRSGGRRYAATGTYYWPGAAVAFKWAMPRAGVVRFAGAVQGGGARILGQWADGHGDDGGALLVRLGR